MKNYVQRIVDVRPTLVLVEKTVSRIAQDMLLEHGITLVINVKSVSVFCIYSLKKPWLLNYYACMVGMQHSFPLMYGLCCKWDTGVVATLLFKCD